VNPILAAADEVFRHRAFEQLLEAGCDDLQVVELPAALEDLLSESDQPLVVVGGTWPAPRPFLRVAVNGGALPVVLLQSSAPEIEREVLAMGARASLHSEISASSLTAALAAVNAGLVVLEPASDTPRQPSNRNRPLTSREREILALVAGGTSNKGVARALGVSANTVKFHLAAVFDKLHAATRAEAVAEAIRRGELSL
jgi:DNA-binding CsgD family transcriptional regulator